MKCVITGPSHSDREKTLLKNLPLDSSLYGTFTLCSLPVSGRIERSLVTEMSHQDVTLSFPPATRYANPWAPGGYGAFYASRRDCSADLAAQRNHVHM